MLENRINENSGYRSGNWQVQNNKLSKEFERSSLEFKKKKIARNILNILYLKKKVSTNILNHFQFYSNVFSLVDHLLIIISQVNHLPIIICIKHLLKIAPFLVGPVSLKQMASFEHSKNGNWLRKFLQQDNMFFGTNVSNTKSKNLLLASPLKQNWNKIRIWLEVPELITAPLSYARHI